MAKVRFGGGVSEMRGSIAGNVFSRARSGAIVRNRIAPIQPNTSAQSFVRANFQSATDGFKALTAAEVLEWNEVAQTVSRFNSLGETYTPSGKQLYMESALNQYVIGNDVASVSLDKIQTDPNLPSLEPYALNLTVVGTAITVMTISSMVSSNGTHLVVQATPPLLPSYGNKVGSYRQIVADALSATEPLIGGYTLQYPSAIDPAAIGNVIHVRARAINSDTGLSSAWIYASAPIPEEVP